MKTRKLLLFLLFLILGSVAVLAAYSVSINWVFNKSNFDVQLYHCVDSACSTVDSKLIDTHTSGSSYYMYYSTSGSQKHAAYFFKEGYRARGYIISTTGSFSTIVADSFTKKDYCKSIIDALSVSDDNPTQGDSISVSTTIQSAFSEFDDDPGTPDYEPTTHDDWFTSDITVKLDVKQGGSTIMSLPAKIKPIYEDLTADVTFNLDTSSLSAGTYTLELKTDPTDSICNQGNKIIKTKTKTISVEAANTAPIINGIPDQTVDEDSGLHDGMIDLWAYAEDAEDADSDLMFTIVSETHPEIIKCELDSYRYVDCTTQTDMFGYSEVTVKVEDTEGLTDTDTFKITVEPDNDPPIVSDIPGEIITEGEDFTTFDLDDYITDIDNTDAEIDWTVTGDVDLNVDIDSDHVVTITYDCGWTGSETLTFEAEDPGSLTDSDDATFTVEEKPNEAPVITGIEVYVFEDSGLNEDIIDLWDYASDEEDDVEDLIFTIVSESNTSVVDCELDSNQYIDCTTQTNMFGYSEVTVEVEDTEGLTDTAIFTIHVSSVNDAPVVSDIEDQTITEGDDFTTFDLDDYVTDVEDDDEDIEWTVTGDVDLEVDIDSDTHIVTITYPDSWTGSETLTFEAKDLDGATDSDEATFTVEEPNTAPVIDGIPNKVLDENSGLNDDLVDLWDYAEDEESPVSELEFTIIEQTNKGLVDCEIDSNRRIDCEVDDDETGYSYVTVQVKDPQGLTDTDEFKITVREWNDDDDDNDGNNNLEITKVSYDEKVKAGDYMHINVYVDGETNNLVTGAFMDALDVYESFAKNKGIHVQIPENALPGKYEMMISVSNGHDKDVVYRDFYVVEDPDTDDGTGDDITSSTTGMTVGNTEDVIDGKTFLLEGIKGVLVGLFFLLIMLVVFLIILKVKNR